MYLLMANKSISSREYSKQKTQNNLLWQRILKWKDKDDDLEITEYNEE